MHYQVWSGNFRGTSFLPRELGIILFIISTRMSSHDVSDGDDQVHPAYSILPLL